MGAGTSVGVIDNPIQRERHTDYPMISGSSIKGALRHYLLALWGQKNGAREIVTRLFGPEPSSSSDHAGALSFSDAQLVAFPVRCVKGAFVYATSPSILARLKRVLEISGISVEWDVPKLNSDREMPCLMADSRCMLDNEKLFLETFEFTAGVNENLKSIALWLSEKALPKEPAFEFFRGKITKDFVLLSEEDFSYFVRNATIVEPHVCIDDLTGAAKEGGLFYTENLPPEAILVTLAMASVDRSVDRRDQALSAAQVMELLLKGRTENTDSKFPGIDGQLIQIGGDATIGRGQVIFSAVFNSMEV